MNIKLYSNFLLASWMKQKMNLFYKSEQKNKTRFYLLIINQNSIQHLEGKPVLFCLILILTVLFMSDICKM